MLWVRVDVCARACIDTRVHVRLRACTSAGPVVAAAAVTVVVTVVLEDAAAAAAVAVACGGSWGGVGWVVCVCVCGGGGGGGGGQRARVPARLHTLKCVRLLCAHACPPARPHTSVLTHARTCVWLCV